jgi:hypothetical protein
MTKKPILLAPPAFAFAFASAFALASAGAGAAELSADCKAVSAAMEKTIGTDHTTAIVRNGVTSHGVTAGGVNYVEIKGAWRKSPMSAKDMIAQEHENIRDAKEYRCQRVGDAMVDGVPVTVYKTHTVTDSATDEGTIAIARGTGLAVQVEGDLKGDANFKFVAHYGYGNVKPPM